MDSTPDLLAVGAALGGVELFTAPVSDGSAVFDDSGAPEDSTQWGNTKKTTSAASARTPAAIAY
jgi:hypothetical protein